MSKSIPLQHVLDTLKLHGYIPEQSGKEWKSICPAHKGMKADLKIGLNEGGKVVAFCRNQCTTESIYEAIGLTQECFSLHSEHGETTPAKAAGSPVLVCMSDVEAQEVNWLWPGRLPLGRLSLLVGRPGEGKSFATLDLAARVSTGSNWPDGSTCKVGNVLLVSAEDDPGDTIRPRLDAHEADPDRVFILKGVHAKCKTGKLIEGAFTLADIDPLRQALKIIEDVRLIVIDPIGSYMGGRVDAHRDNEVRGVLAPLAALAQETGAAVLLVAHQRKGAAINPDDMVLGSRAFTGLARSVLHLMRDPDDEDRRLLLSGKMNLAEPATGLSFTIGDKPARVNWSSDVVNISAAEVLAKITGGNNAGDDAGDWLRDVLSDGAVESSEIKSMAERDGLAWRTIERAKKRIGVTSRREGFGIKGRWMWTLPSIDRQHEPKTAIDSIVGNVADYDGVCDSNHLDGITPAEIHGLNLNNETRRVVRDTVELIMEGDK
tara:strand:+ start:16327 stop:17793 length:1467 start_codon:yes stop_codon:yes gene_type:complete